MRAACGFVDHLHDMTFCPHFGGMSTAREQFDLYTFWMFPELYGFQCSQDQNKSGVRSQDNKFWMGVFRDEAEKFGLES
jgi:hypothetical protein